MPSSSRTACACPRSRRASGCPAWIPTARRSFPRPDGRAAQGTGGAGRGAAPRARRGARAAGAVAGPGDIDEQREELPASVLDHVTFLGRISDEDKARALRSVDVYVAPHTGGESFGIVLVEAMAAQAAVVASDLPAFRRVLEDGASGRLFPNQDADALAEALIELLVDPEQRARYVAAADVRVREFDWDRVVDDVIAVYDSVHMPGEKVTEDLRGQLVGRLAGRGGTA